MEHVLLLEEDGEGRETLARVLSKRGFRVVPAEDQMTALSVLTSGLPISVVLAGATYRDRIDFLSDLRETRPNLPVIFLTDYCSPESRLRGMKYGAFSMSRRLNFYINMRPVELDELDRMIRIVLGKQCADHAPGLSAA